MLDLDDFVHLPQLEPVFERILRGEPGLIVVGGIDPPAGSDAGADAVLPSGRATVFRILLRRFLQQESVGRAFVLTRDRDAFRKGRSERQKVEIVVEPAGALLAARIQQAAARVPSLIVVDRLDRETAAAALQAAARVPVLTQLETGARAADLARETGELGVDRALLAGLRWGVAVQRLPALCRSCAHPVTPDGWQLAALRRRAGPGEALPVFQEARGCEVCGGSGRYGEVTVFDIYDHAAGEPVLPQERYALGLAAGGHLSLDDVLGLESAQLRRAYHLMTANEGALRQANAELQRRVMELESAHRVLVQRTEALNALQRMGEALLSDIEPQGLAEHICRQVRDVCGADRSVLYRLTGDGSAEVLAAGGWERSRFAPVVPAAGVLSGDETQSRVVKYDDWPPGIPRRTPDLEGAELRAGLRVALVAQGTPVGALFVYSTVRQRFEPGQAALLQTIAAQAAVALQRAGLITELRGKVHALEEAHRELAVKERMARELELAREVQQSFLPRSFPDVPPYRFAAENEPAREVGGDFYDVFELQEGRVALVIADVSDKGMPAALYMALTRSLIRAEARRLGSPREVLAEVNRLLLEVGEPGMFVTVFYGVLDAGERRLTYARAGHDEPLLVRDGTVTSLGGGGMLLGIFEEACEGLEERTVELLRGDTLVLYTDGLTDVQDPAGEVLGPAGFAGLVAAAAAGGAAPERVARVCSDIFDRLRGYMAGAEQGDDMTLLVVGDGA